MADPVAQLGQPLPGVVAAQGGADDALDRLALRKGERLGGDGPPGDGQGEEGRDQERTGTGAAGEGAQGDSPGGGEARVANGGESLAGSGKRIKAVAPRTLC